MNAASSPGNPSEKRAKPASWAKWIFQLLRMFWVTELTLLLVVLYGLYAGWSVPKQWSDAFFYAAVAQILIAATTIEGSSEDISAASVVRHLAKGDISETRRQIDQIAVRRETFSLRVFIGSLLTILIALLVTRM